MLSVNVDLISHTSCFSHCQKHISAQSLKESRCSLAEGSDILLPRRLGGVPVSGHVRLTQLRATEPSRAGEKRFQT